MNPDQHDSRQLAWRLLLETHGALLGRLTDELRDELAMPMTWYDALLHLSEGADGRRRMTDLARAVVVSKSGLTTIVDRLEEAGLVRREVPPNDRRAIEVVMTEEGRSRFEAARRLHRRGIDRHFCDRITPEEGDALIAILGRLHDEALGLTPVPRD